MDKLRVGGPCVVEGQRYVFSHAAHNDHDYPDDSYPELHMDGYFYDVYPDAMCSRELGEITPAPFLPGDVVEHSARPGLRELVDDAGETGCRTHGQDGETRFYYYSSVVAQRYGEGDIASLTLILPAQPTQPAQEARDAR